jgi:DNA-binding MarR family transcriptional regulator
MEEQWMAARLDRLEDVWRRLFQHFRVELERSACSISPSQFPLLKLLEESGELTVSEAAAHLAMSVAGATGLIDRLVRAGLVERRRDEGDRRLVFVSLSPNGKAALAEARRLRRSVLVNLMAALTPDEVDQFIGAFEKMHAALVRESKEEGVR